MSGNVDPLWVITRQYSAGTHHEFLLLPQSLLAQEHDGGLKHEAHRVQLETLLDLAEEIGDVEPLDTAVVQKIARAQVDRLSADEHVNDSESTNQRRENKDMI